MGIVGRLDQYASMLAGEFDDYSMSENLFLYSEQFDNTYWGKVNSTLTSNQIAAPDGTLTADKWVANVSADSRLATQQVRPDATYAFSFYAKSAGFTQFRTNILGRNPTAGSPEARILWDLSAISATLEIGSASISIQSVGNGWFRCITIYTKSGTSTDLEVRPLATLTGDGTSGIYIWGAQLENGSVATDYTPTTTTAITRVLPSTTNTNITGFSTYFSSGFSENVGAATTLVANVFPPYDLVYDDFGGTLFGAGQGRYMRQNTDKSVIVYNEIDEVSDFRDIVRTGLVLDLDAAQPLSYKGTGTVWNDLSGNGNNFTLVNPTYYSFDSSIDSISFTRTLSPTPEDGGYATLNTSGILTAANYLHNNHTTEVWFKSNDRNPTNYDATENLSVVVAYTGFHCMWHYNTTTYQYTIWGKTSGVNNIYTQTISDSTSGVWTQLVAVRTGNTLDLYKNGVFQNTGTITAGTEGIPSNNIIRIAAANYGGQYSWHANLNFASLKMYTRALTATEVLQNYNALKHRFGL